MIFDRMKLDKNYISDKFVDEYIYYQKDNKYTTITRDLQNGFNLHKKRLEKLKLRVKHNYTFLPSFSNGEKENHKPGKEGEGLTYSVKRQTLIIDEMPEKKSMKMLYDKTESLEFKVCTINLKNSEEIKNKIYSCPNCGNNQTIEEFINKGCASCNTHYEFRDLYPKVSNLIIYPYDKFLHGTPGSKKFEILLRTIVFASLCFIVIDSIIIHKFVIKEYTNEQMAYYVSLSFMQSFVAGYVCAAISTILEIIYVGIKTLVDYPFKTALTKKKMREQLHLGKNEYDPNYIESKLISLLRIIFYSDDKKPIIYNGNQDLSEFKNIVDFDYKTLELVETHEDEKWLFATFKVYLNVYAYIDFEIKKERRVYSVTLQKDKDVNIDFDFNLSAIKCYSCGASFDAYKELKCPYCGTENDIVYSDWVINNITREKR